MTLRPISVLLRGCALVALGALAGCGHAPGAGDASQHPAVKVSKPVVRDVRAYEDFTGRTDAVESVEVRSRVSGYLDQILFEPGAIVKKGQALFKIDPRPYQAALGQADGQVALYQASVERLTRDYDRNRPLVKTGAISPQDFDKIVGDKGQAEGSLTAAKANVESAKLNLQFTDIFAPVDGRVGRNLITVGNLVTLDQTLLTTVVSQDPMYAYFDVDERTMLHLQQLIREGKIRSARRSKDIPILCGLANEEGHPHQGTIDFVNNQVDSSTGTIQVRASFPNPANANGDRVLTPGLFVRIRLPVGDPKEAVLVSERVIGADQGLKYVYVIDDKNTVERRSVTLGALHEVALDEAKPNERVLLREITKGLKSDEWVVVAGLQRLVPGAEVRPEQLKTMPAPRAGSRARSGAEGQQ
jgi:RND family efflux transporter MFP subunit